MFNLSKYSQVPIEPIAPTIMDESNDVRQTLDGDVQNTDVTKDEIADAADDQGERDLIDQATNVAVWKAFVGLQQTRPDLAEAMKAVMVQSGIQNLELGINAQNVAALDQMIDEKDLRSATQMLDGSPQVTQWNLDIQNLLERIKSTSDQAARNRAETSWPVAFNLKQHKTAQMPMEHPPMEPPMAPPMESPMAAPEEPLEETSRFPVTSVADFVDKFVDDLLLFNSEEIETPNYQRAVEAFNEIESVVSGGFTEEVNSALETITEMSQEQRTDAVKILMEVYEVFLPDIVKQEQPQQEEIIMSNKQPKGIIRFNLNEHILNNKTAEKSEGLTKTAADQFGQQYLLYGPTEKRICPKLRGKNMSVGDVVSEYTCRHHCIDGIVIDDNKTICGEALWRANAMDKYSREYVDKDGKITGGYLNKRFETNRLNIDDENRMKLKPGETRKPRPASQGNMESRLQDMRNKEGQKRDYRPNVNTGKPFEWCHDVDQNNVQVTQSEKNKREEATGHDLVQYTNRDQGENNSKKAFNLKNHKTAQLDFTGNPQPHRTFDQMGKDFSPEGTSNHCQSCQKRVPTNSLKSEDDGMGGLMSVCPDCQHSETNDSKPMTGPFDSDNPQSDDLGLSDDFLRDGLDYESDTNDADDWIADRSPEEVEFQSDKAEVITTLINDISGMSTKEEVLNYLHEQLNNPDNPPFDNNDLDDITNETNSHLEGLGESTMGPDEFNYAANKKTTKQAELPHPMQVKRPHFTDRNTDAHNKKIDKHIPSVNPAMVRTTANPADIDPKNQTYDYGKPMKKKKSFNLKSFKTAKKEDKDGDFSYEGEDFDVNPFAVCNKSTGGKNKAGKEKWERCVQKVKNKSKKTAQSQPNPMNSLAPQPCKSCGQPVAAREQMNNNGLCSRCTEQQATQGPMNQTSGGMPIQAASFSKKKSKLTGSTTG